jgi:hypothetical protein
MAEVLRFRVARGVQRREPPPEDLERIYSPGSLSPFLRSVRAIATEPPPADPRTDDRRDRLRAAAEALVADGPFLNPDVQSDDPVLGALQALDRWLVAAGNQPDPADVDKRLDKLADDLDVPRAQGKTGAERLVGDPRWADARTVVGDSLVAAMLLDDALDLQAKLVRLRLVAGLVDRFGGLHAVRKPKAAPEVLALLGDRVVVLPSPPFPLRRWLGQEPVLARRPAFADMFVVRDEWSCYQPGEIAHIENVLRGELKERIHKRTDETEITEVTETERTTTDERDNQTTDRYNLQDEADRDARLAIHVEGQVDTQGQYGPTRVATHIGGSVDWSLREASRHATEQAKETVERTVHRVEERVRQQRTVRTLARIEETNTHKLDNATQPAGNVTGMYRWVDKVQRLQIFRRPNRYLLEFQVPEPATYLRWLHARPSVATVTPEPAPFTDTGKPDGKPLTIADIQPGKYQQLAARYQAQGIDPPPADTVMAAASAVFDPEDKSLVGDEGPKLHAPPKVMKVLEIPVPEGYLATKASTSLSAVQALGEWGDYQSAADPKNLSWAHGYHYTRADITVAGTAITLEDAGRGTVWNRGEFRESGWLQVGQQDVDLPKPGVGDPKGGKVNVAVVLAGSFGAVVSVGLTCKLAPAKLEQWQIDTYNRIATAYFALKRQHDQELAAQQVQQGVMIEGSSPARNAEVAREELKRQVIELLLGDTFHGAGALKPTPNDGDGWPRMDLAAVRRVTPLVQFVEQALEWPDMTYVLYPYFWADEQRWDTLEGIESADPDFAKFLRAGSARVVVAARPGFEHAVDHFMVFGQPWGGGPAPTPDEPLYLSVAQELRDLTGGSGDGEAGESWEMRLPTTLVWLDPDPTLPKQNDHRRLDAPADPLCG